MSRFLAKAASYFLLRRRVMISALLILFPVVVFAGSATFAAISAFRAAEEERLVATARALAAVVDARLSEQITALRVLSGSRRLDAEVSPDAFEQRMRPVAEHLRGRIVLFGPLPDLAVLAVSPSDHRSSVPRQIPEGISPDISRFIDTLFAQDRPFVSNLVFGPIQQRLVIGVVVPLRRDGYPHRALALTFEPAALRELLADQRLPDGTFAAIADGRQRILAHSSDPEGKDIGRPAPAWVTDAIEGKRSLLVTGPGWGGRQNVYAVERPTQAPNWTVTVAQPVHAQQESAWRAVKWMIAGAIALALGLAAAVWLSRLEAIRDAQQEADALRQGRAEVERLHGRLPAIIFLREVASDGSSRLLYHGGDLEKVTGWPASEVATEQDFDRLIHAEDTTVKQGMLQLLQDGHVASFCRIRQPDGSWRTLMLRAHTLERLPGSNVEVVGYMTDETSQRNAEARALSAARLASLGEMAAGLAHELKQPLAVAVLATENAELLLEAGDLEGAKLRISHIAQQMLRAGKVIDHLRRYSCGPEMKTPPEPVELDQVIDGVRSLIDGALRDSNVVLDVDLGEPPPRVMGDVVALEQVLVNLLSNSRDALADRPPGAPRLVRVSVVARSDSRITFTVSDNGGGIAPRVLDRLFEPFVTTKLPDRGTGLGLSLCHALVKRMGGTIEAANSPEGAVFTITLKCAATAQDKQHDAVGANGAQEARE